MTTGEEILKILNTTKFYYKGIPMNGFLLPVFENKNPQSVRNEYNRLYKNGYISKKDGNYFINKNGKKFLENKKQILKNFEPIKNNNSKNLLLLYDIPENKKCERDWFRRTLIKFGFIMIQRSVWVGPSPLPKEFLDYVKSIGLKGSIKTFKLEKDYNLPK